MPSKKPVIAYRPDTTTYSQLEGRAKELGLGLSQLVDQLVKASLTDSATLEQVTASPTRPFYQDALEAIQVGETIDRRHKDIYSAISGADCVTQLVTLTRSNGAPQKLDYRWLPKLGLVLKKGAKAASGYLKWSVVWKGEPEEELTIVDGKFLDPETCQPWAVGIVPTKTDETPKTPTETLTLSRDELMERYGLDRWESQAYIRQGSYTAPNGLVWTTEPSIYSQEPWTTQAPSEPQKAASEPPASPVEPLLALETLTLTKEAFKARYNLDESQYSAACCEVVQNGHWLAPDERHWVRPNRKTWSGTFIPAETV